MMVNIAVNITMLVDAFVLGTEVGVAFQEDKENQFRGGWFVCILCSLMVFTLLMLVKTFEMLLEDISNPYGGAHIFV